VASASIKGLKLMHRNSRFDRYKSSGRAGRQTGPGAMATVVRSRNNTSRRGSVSSVAWVPPKELDLEEWLVSGRQLGTISRCSQWWIADWLIYGSSRWGEKYVTAAKVTGYDPASLRNIAYVGRRFDVSLRSDKLSWSHHALLAPLDEPARRQWLERAAEERLSVADLRVELRTDRKRDKEEAAASAPPEIAHSASAAVTCPHCGGQVPLTA
jgi:hypothetical protein